MVTRSERSASDGGPFVLYGLFDPAHLQNASLQIERWLNEMQRQRGWADNTWNRYCQMFNSLFVRAIKWKHGTIARMTQNPMAAIDRLWHILTSQEQSPRYARLSTADKRAIVEILRDTKPGLHAYCR